MDVYLDNADTVVFGNPHSEGSPSSASTQNSVDRVRRRILRHFNASPQDYCVVFTQNASNAVKIIADGLPWATGWPDNLNSQRQEVRAPTTSHLHQLIKSLIIRVTKCLFSPFIRLFRPRKSTKLILLQDNHTSIIGLRAVAQHHCASVSTLDPISFDRETKQNTEFDCRLFAFPAQSNFNGYQYPLHWLNNIKQHPRSLSLLDACSFVGTSRLDLQCYPADFVAISFYKIFGFPTGIGALLARRSALDMLTENRYFAGGTIKGATGLGSNISRHLFHKHHARFEYGTLPFMEIIALEAGFDVLDSELGGIDSVSSHTAELAEEMIDRMLALKHKNGQNLCKIYRGSGYASFDDKYPARHGPIINFNLFTADGNPLKPSSVQRLASLKNIHLRNQSFCNPGASQLHLEIDDEHMSKYLDERDSEEIACGMHDFSLSDGRLISSLRISFGPTSTLADIENFHNFLREFFLCDPLILKFPRNSKTPLISVQEICIYPIKSCGKFSVSSWKLEDRGLVYDREWMIIDRATKRPLSQKRFSRMCLIKPEICLQNRIMHIKAEGMRRISVSLEQISWPAGKELDSRVCRDYTRTMEYTDKGISDWFSEFLGVDCILVRFQSRSCGSKAQRRLANESPVLLVSKNSLSELNAYTDDADCVYSKRKIIDISCFRANLVIEGSEPFLEDRCKAIKIGESNCTLEMIGQCNRCHMICIDQHSSAVSNEPYLSLARFRGDAQAVNFGVHLRSMSSSMTIRTGDYVEMVMNVYS